MTVVDREKTWTGDDRTVLVRGVNWIGDAVMTIPALRLLKRSLPGSSLSLLVKPWVAPLFEKDPHVDGILLYTGGHEGISGKFRLAGELRKRRFSHAVLFQNAFDAALLAFLAGIPSRIGYNRDGRGWLLTRRVPLDAHAKGLHHIDYYLNLVRKAGFDAPSEMPWLFLGHEERLSGRDRLQALRRPVIAVNPGATYGSSKRWHPERFAEVAGRIISQLGGSVVLLGGPSETSIGNEIISHIDSSMTSSSTLLNLAGRTTLRELAAVISESDMLVTNDSGPMHIGYAVGTPVIAIFGSTSPEATGPVGRTDIVISHKTECSPCFERECRKSAIRCMDLITADEVYGAIAKTAKKERAVFFDRDGTLCRDAHYLSRMEDFEIFPAISELKLLGQRGLSLIGVTNQSGIARGIVQEAFVREVNAIFRQRYGFRDFYCCPHHPDDNCSCRKPEPGMLLRARDEHGIDLKKSFVVGDKHEDMILARNVGARAILVKTGKVTSSDHADAVAEDLGDAVRRIIEMDRGGNA